VIRLSFILDRIIFNNVKNVQKRNARGIVVSYDQFVKLFPAPGLQDLTDTRSRSVDRSLILEEFRELCESALSTCLNQEQRSIFLAGELLEVNDHAGSRLFNISRVNFRKKLSRARKSVYGFIRTKYGDEYSMA